MAFEALLDNKIIISHTFTDEEWLQLQVANKNNKTQLHSLICHHKVYPVRGTERNRQHFSHYPNDAECQYATSEESLEHYLIKQIIADTATMLGYKNKIEKSLGKEVRNDVSIWVEENHYALEVQLANQTHASYAVRTQARARKNVKTIWLTTSKANLTIPEITSFYMKGVYSNENTLLENNIFSEKEYYELLKNSIRVETYDTATDTSEELELDVFLKNILTNDSVKPFKPVKDFITPAHVVRNGIDCSKPFYANLNCTCKKFTPETNYDDLMVEEKDILVAAEKVLSETVGEQWCHRDDNNPMMRLTVDEIGVHRTVEEMLKYGFIKL